MDQAQYQAALDVLNAEMKRIIDDEDGYIPMPDGTMVHRRTAIRDVQAQMTELDAAFRNA